MNFARFFALSFSLCLQFVSRIGFSTIIGWNIDNYFNIFPFATIAFTILGGYLGLRALIAVGNRKYDDA